MREVGRHEILENLNNAAAERQPILVEAQDKAIVDIQVAKEAMCEELSDRVETAVASFKANFKLGKSQSANRLATECITFLQAHGCWNRIIQDAQNYRVQYR